MTTEHITVLYFAQIAELTQKRNESWVINSPVSVAEWLNEIVTHYPALSPLKARLKVAINQYHVSHEAIIHANDEVALFEPVTGG